MGIVEFMGLDMIFMIVFGYVFVIFLYSVWMISVFTSNKSSRDMFGLRGTFAGMMMRLYFCKYVLSLLLLMYLFIFVCVFMWEMFVVMFWMMGVML